MKSKMDKPPIRLMVVDCQTRNQGMIFDGIHDDEHFIGLFEAYSDEAYSAIKKALEGKDKPAGDHVNR